MRATWFLQAVKHAFLKSAHIGHVACEVYQAAILCVFTLSSPAEAFAALITPWHIIPKALALIVLAVTVHSLYKEAFETSKKVTEWWNGGDLGRFIKHLAGWVHRALSRWNIPRL